MTTYKTHMADHRQPCYKTRKWGPSQTLCGGCQALEAENAALAQQLAGVGKGAALAESTMRELATLHQMLSTQARMQNPEPQALTHPPQALSVEPGRCACLFGSAMCELATLHRMLSTQARMQYPEPQALTLLPQALSVEPEKGACIWERHVRAGHPASNAVHAGAHQQHGVAGQCPTCRFKSLRHVNHRGLCCTLKHSTGAQVMHQSEQIEQLYTQVYPRLLGSLCPRMASDNASARGGALQIVMHSPAA